MRSALWAVMCVVVALFSMSCAGGADEIGNGAAGSGDTPTCNNMILETNLGEECEPMIPLDSTMTCPAMGLAHGTIVCTSTCTLLNMCTGDDTSVGGSGGGGTGG